MSTKDLLIKNVTIFCFFWIFHIDTYKYFNSVYNALPDRASAMLNEAEQVFLINFVISVMLGYLSTMITACLGVFIYAASNNYFNLCAIKNVDVTKARLI